MGYNKPGVRDGSGTAKNSYQRKTKKVGRRQAAGLPCPKAKKK